MCPLWVLLILVIEPRGANAKFKGMQKMVVNGVEMLIEQYPYLAQVAIDGSVACGGAIISKRVVTTAGHCVYDVDEETMTSALDFDVYVGSSYAMHGTHYDVCKVVKHPKYGNAQFYYYYDVGLLLLAKDIKIGTKVRIATIAPHQRWRNVKHTLSIAGFGYVYNTDDQPNQIYATRMHYVDPHVCGNSQTGEGDYMPVPEHMFCMVGNAFTSDCFGDSGSPITWRKFVVGLVSHGRDSSCGSEAMPSLYTDLTYFKSWVMTQVKLLESAPKEKCDEKLREKQRLKKRKDQLKQQQMRNKTKKKVKKENLSKLMNLIPITKNTNVQHSIFFEAWPIYSPPFR